ncbi:MAG: AMP-binding protein [bacterium]
MAFALNPMILAHTIEQRTNESPDKTVVTIENGPDQPDEPLTYSRIFQSINRLSAYLKRNGIGRGDTFALVMRNHPEFLYAFGAASATGAVVVPIDPRSKGGKLSFQVANTKCKGIIVTTEFLETVEALLPEMGGAKILAVIHKPWFGPAASSRYPSYDEIQAMPDLGPPRAAAPDPEGKLEIIHTSGTTGDPKGVALKGSRMPMFATLAQLVWGYTQEDVLYTGLSLTHGNAQAVTLVPSLSLAVPSVISMKFTKSRIWDVCRKYGCTTFSLLGGMMSGIYNEPRKPNDGDNPVRKVLSAGTPRAIWEEFEKRFNVKIHEWYGAVEGGFAHNPPGFGPIGSFGKPLEGVMEMKVVDEEDRQCPPFAPGELISRLVGQPTEVEYVGQKEASARKTRGGWLRSGDICHTDEQGWLYFDFRKGGGLRRQGDFIQPDHVEKIVGENGNVSEVCVYGIPAASGAPGESDLVAAVAPFPGKRIGEQEVREIFTLCRRGLEANAVPSFIQVVDEIPKTASEKALDRLLREAFSPAGKGVYRFEDYA